MEIQWSLLLFSLIAGTGGSLLAFNALSELLGYSAKSRKLITILSIVLVIIGGFCSVLHLEQKANIMAAAANVFSFSPISMELIMVGFTTVFGIIYLVCLIKEVSDTPRKVVAVLCILAGLALGFVTGDGYRMGAQPLWNTITLPLAYLATDLAAGGALYLASTSALKDTADAGNKPAVFATVCAVLALAACAAYGLAAGAEGIALAPEVFWAGVIVAAVINLVCAAIICAKGVKLPVAVVGLVFALCAGCCLRVFMWLLGTGTLDLFTAAAAHAVL